MSRRRYSAEYRSWPKRKRDAYRRATLKDDNGRAVYRVLGIPYPTRRRRKRKQKQKCRRITRAQRKQISRKIRILMREGYPQRQAIAVAYRMAGISPVCKRKRRHGRKRR